MTDDDTARPLAEQALDVYASRDGGWWNPDHGDVEVPDGWQLPPAGDAYLTRTVKRLGVHWLAWQPRSGSGTGGTPPDPIGILAPADSITQAQQMPDFTDQPRNPSS